MGHAAYRPLVQAEDDGGGCHRRVDDNGPAPHARDAGGGRARGVVDGGLPPVLFTLLNAVVGANTTRQAGLASAIATAPLAGVIIVVLRLVRREPLRQALAGLAGLAIAIGFAIRSGEAREFFLPGIYVDAAYALVFLAAAVIGRPLIRGRRTGCCPAAVRSGGRTYACTAP